MPLALLAAAVAMTAPAAKPPAVAPACPPRAEVPALAALRDAQVADDRGASLPAAMKLLVADLPAISKNAQDDARRDWPALCRYRADNARLHAAGMRPRVVFIGDSITENWGVADPSLFAPTTVDRGIAGQTSGQILLRFYQDVVRLSPRVVHLNAGTNDLGVMGSTVVTDDEIVDNLRAMIDMAQANRIAVVLTGILPSTGSTLFHTSGEPRRIRAINARLSQLADERRIVFVDYAAAIGDAEGGIRAGFTNDGVHPNRAAYAAMRPLAERAIARAGR
ncbi:GDSL-type esterase/lipase family protein [Sphingomonas sp. RP10(2022)]|uniref:GDSL-type esterase/lipase family protein n=1 Tax=Sphingomonas liriopis TaxID=2949094 RepID=A0A9X2HVM0_9SPHN|nr:GDSL-type esterase/lipase family protein [Sphingomonas liriopis]MCP3733535.1 GDSL-type esterase/lipase family protein [Sphingomonas liriopis]